MKRAFLLTLSAAALLSFAGCKRCTTCHLEWEQNGQTETYYYEEVCGKKSQIEDYENACKDAATSAGGRCLCEEG